MKALRVNLFIGTPAYNSQCHTDYLHSIISYHEKNIPFAVMTLGNESLVTRGRNTVLSYFYRAENFTHLLFLDADMYLHADDLIRLLAAEKDIIGAAVALKGYNAETGQPVYNTGKILSEEENGLITTNRVGTAVFLLSRKAVDALVQEAIRTNDVYFSNPHSRGDAQPDTLMYDCFKVGVVDKDFETAGDYLSEDYYVCNTLRRLGFDIFVDTNIRPKHNGMFVFQ